MTRITSVILLALSVLPQAFSQVVIDSAWLAGKSAPYYLDQAGTRYTLATDIETDGTAFAVIANDITFDLYGHRVTYNDAAPIEVPNGSFEADDGWSWSKSGGPYAGSYLQNELHLGQRALRFVTPCEDQFCESLGTVTLLPNTQYSFSAMLQKGGGSAVASIILWGELVGVSGEPTRRFEKSNGNNRGIQFTDVTFTTGPAAETYRVRVGIAGASGVAAGAAYVDDVRIVRTYNYGVIVGVSGSGLSAMPGVARTGNASGFKLLNGILQQGQDCGRECSAVLQWNASDVRIEGVDVTVAGPLTKAIWAQFGGPTTVLDCEIESNVLTIRSRDQFDASMIGNNFYGVVSGCEFRNGPHMGIRTISNQPSIISGNTFRMRNRFTNGFAIGARGPGTAVARNVVENIGEYNGRGIQCSGSSTAGMRITDNVVRVQALPLNQEYKGSLVAYGIQCESSESAVIEGNYVEVVGVAGEASAFRANNNPLNTIVRHNTFVARQVTPGVEVAAVQFTNLHGDLGNVFESNTLRTNKNFVGGTDNCTGIVWKSTTLEIDGTPSPDARWFESEIGTNPSQLIEWRWVDNVYSSPEVAALFDAPQWRRVARPQLDAFSSMRIAWTVDVGGTAGVYDAVIMAGTGSVTVPPTRTVISQVVGGFEFVPEFGLIVR